MLSLNLAHEPDDALRVRAAWLYYVAGLNQGEAAARLGLHRTRVVRLLAEARDRGLVSVTIQHEAARELETERAVCARYGLDFCLGTPPVGLGAVDPGNGPLVEAQGLIARRAVGSAAASLLRGRLAAAGAGGITVGVGWGRTVEQVAFHLAGVRSPAARFVSLMGSLTRNSASNPFEVVQAFAARTGGEGHFLPVPFVADTAADREVLMSQRTVADALRLARSADLYLISVGELGRHSLLRRQGMLSPAELDGACAGGAVCDALGRLFGRDGRLVPHELNGRTLAVEAEDLRGRDVVLLGAGLEKLAAIDALLRSGLVRGLVVDGDTALRLARPAPDPGPPAGGGSR